MQLHLAEAEPLVGVKLARTLEAVAEQVQNDGRPNQPPNASSPVTSWPTTSVWMSCVPS